MELNYSTYLSASKYFSQVKFRFNSKFKYDYARLKPFANFIDLGLISVYGFI